MEGIIILGITVLVMIGLAIFAITQGQKPIIPYKAQLTIQTKDGVDLVFHGDLKLSQSAINQIVDVITLTIHMSKPLSNKSTNMIRILTLSSQKEWDDYAVRRFGANPTSNGICVATPQMFGHGAPLLILKNVFAQETLVALAIHECLHVYFPDHKLRENGKVWFDHGRQDSIEGKLYDYSMYLFSASERRSLAESET